MVLSETCGYVKQHSTLRAMDGTQVYTALLGLTWGNRGNGAAKLRNLMNSDVFYQNEIGGF